METRAHHILIGVFMLSMVMGLFAFILWAAKIDIDAEFAFYDIYFEQSVAGLTMGGDVTYNGVNVGQVTRLTIDPSDPSRVRVTIRIASETPIREDVWASLEFQSLTGVSYVQIAGGSADSPPLVAGPDETLPVIESRASQIQELFAGAPDLINRGIVLVDRVTRVFDQANLDKVAGILGDVESLTQSLADRRERLGNIIDNADATLAELREAAVAVNRLSGTAEKVVGEDLRSLVADLRGVAGSIRGLTDGLDQAIKDNSTALAGFSSSTLPEVALFVQEARRLVTSFSRIAERIERSPGELIFPAARPEYEPQ